MKKNIFSLPKRILLLLTAAGTLLLVLQFFRPTLEMPPVTGDFKGPEAVHQILQRACYNCHSNETRLAWFDRIVPAYWLVSDHVKRARKVINFSSWDSLSAADQKARLVYAFNAIQWGSMPLESYTALHPEARLTSQDVVILKDYIRSQLNGAGGTAPKQQGAAATQLPQPKGAMQAAVVKPAPNGIAYAPDYKNWKVISTTDRFDNNTLRVILGNETAIRALQAGRTHPWPDGSVLAKVAWEQAADSAGNVHPGAFKQVEFMIRDAARYADTKGWGWARWKGMDLVPYGKNAMFTQECVTCHTPMKDNDFVFTKPFPAESK